MQPMLVVQSEEQSELAVKVSLEPRKHNPARCLVFPSSDEAFDNGNAPMVPDGAEPRANSCAFAPTRERIA